MPSRREGLLSLLIASPMTLLGCTTDPLPADTEGSSSGGPDSTSSSTGGADSLTTSGGTSTGDDTTSTSSSSSEGSSSSSTSEVSTSSSGGESSSSGGEESTSTGGGQGNTCERVGELMDMCFGGGYGYYYESSCNYYINYFIAAGDLACAQAYNEVYSCIADLECADVFNGVYEACEVQYDNMYATCWGGGGTFGSESFWGSEVSDGGFVSGGGFIGDTEGFTTGAGSATGWWGSDTGGFGST